MKKPQCVLHVGMPKTGSSSIQQTLCTLGENSQVYYLELGELGNHSVLVYSVFSKNRADYHAHKKANRSLDEINKFNKDNLQRLSEALSQVGSKKVVISGEDIMFLDEEELLEFRKFLLEYVSSIEVVAYIRPPISFMQSALQQNIKEGDLRFGISEYRPQYRNWFEKFDNVFGRERVSLVKFDPKTLQGGDVVSDFCNRIGIRVDSKKHIRANESISLEAMAMLYVFHKFDAERDSGPENYKKNQLLISELSKIGSKKLKFSLALTKSILDNISSDLAWIEDRLGTSLAEQLPDSTEGIASEEELISIAMECAVALSELFAQKLRERLATPQEMATWLVVLRNKLSINLTFSKLQIKRLEAETLRPEDSLRELILLLGRAGHLKAMANVQNKLADFLRNASTKELVDHHDTPELAYSIDAYLDGYIMGWVYNKKRPLQRLNIEIRQRQLVIASGRADQFRQDLMDAEIADGHCAFRLKADIDPTLENEVLGLRVVDFDTELKVKLKSLVSG